MQGSIGVGKYEKRKASHAGSWYSEGKEELDKELGTYLAAAKKELKKGETLKGVIAPHAGFYYSGPTAAWAYINIDPTKYSRVVLLGPSHHAYLDNCALTQSKLYDTPFGPIPIDQDATQELFDKGNFIFMSKKTDEAEHSLEMHIPFIKKMFTANPEMKLLPVMVGNLSVKAEKEFGLKLAPYLQDQNTLFVVSSDFCHWGANFDYFPYNKEDGAIHESIEKMDKQGMELIES